MYNHCISFSVPSIIIASSLTSMYSPSEWGKSSLLMVLERWCCRGRSLVNWTRCVELFTVLVMGVCFCFTMFYFFLLVY